MANRWLAPGLLLVLVALPLAFLPALYDDFTLPKQLVLAAAATALAAGALVSGARFLPTSPLVRALLAAVALLLILSTAMGLDPVGSILGLYQYRQGLLTQAACLVVFLGGAAAFSATRSWGLLRWGTPALAVATLYSALQLAGLDPLDWWLDTSARAIATVGNANELAAYAVVGTAFCAGWRFRDRRLTFAAVAGVTAMSAFLVFAAASRAGLLALALSVVALALFMALIRCPRQEAMLRLGAVVAGFVCGALASTPFGATGHEASRIQSGVAGRDPGAVTRLALWEGTLSTLRASPWTGFGPDGLALAFPQFRPASLGGAFDDYDMVAKSSHNWVLDLAATGGIPLALAMFGLLGAVAVRSVSFERESNDPATAHVLAALAGYLALTLVDPVSITAHAIAWLLFGALLGRADRSLQAMRPRPAPLSVGRGLVFGAAMLPVLAFALVLLKADLLADTGWDAYASGDFGGAASEYRRAARLNPLEPAYVRQEGEAWLARAVVTGSNADLQRSLAAFSELEDRFAAAAGDHFGVATALIGLHQEPAAVLTSVDLAVKANPYGVASRAYASVLRYAAVAGGRLRYSERDRWVYVEPLSPPILPGTGDQ